MWDLEGFRGMGMKHALSLFEGLQVIGSDLASTVYPAHQFPDREAFTSVLPQLCPMISGKNKQNFTTKHDATT